MRKVKVSLRRVMNGSNWRIHVSIERKQINRNSGNQLTVVAVAQKKAQAISIFWHRNIMQFKKEIEREQNKMAVTLRKWALDSWKSKNVKKNSQSPVIQIFFSKNHSPSRRHQGSLEKWPVPKLGGEGACGSLALPESTEMLKKDVELW